MSLPNILEQAIAVFIIILIIFWYYRRRVERVTDQNQYDTFFRRFWAVYIDTWIFFPIGSFIESTASNELGPFTLFAMLFISTLGCLTYSIVAHGLCGQTIGKWVCRVKVVRNTSHATIHMAAASIRGSILFALLTINILYFLSQPLGSKSLLDKIACYITGDYVSEPKLIIWIILVWTIGEVITVLANKNRRAIHDYLAGTIVVRV